MKNFQLNKNHLFIAFLAIQPSLALADPTEDAVRERCRLHLEAAGKTTQSRCVAQGYPKNGPFASGLDTLSSSAKGVCESAVKKMLEKRAEYQHLLQEGTAEAERLRAQVGSGQISVDANAGAFQAQGQVVGAVGDSLRSRNQQILTSLQAHSEIFRALRKKEEQYDSYLSRLASARNPFDSSYCPSLELFAYRQSADRLNSEVVSLRREVAGNVQALNALYQKNLTTLGATQAQAVQLTRNMTDASTLGEIGDDGSVKEATTKSWWQRLFGSPSPHEKEAAVVPCSVGGESFQDCPGSVSAARPATIDDATLAHIGGAGALEARPPSADANSRPFEPGSGASAVASVLAPTPAPSPSVSVGPDVDAQIKQARNMNPEVVRSALNYASRTSSGNSESASELASGSDIVAAEGAYDPSLDSAIRSMMQNPATRESYIRALNRVPASK